MDEAERKKASAAEKLFLRARDLRGTFLNRVAAIERDVATLLTNYFCTEDESKREIFMAKVIGKMSLEMKRVVLIEIVKKDYPRYWDSHGEFLRDLQDIQEFRNKLAHSVIDMSEAALARPIEEGVGFVQWKDGAPITDKEFENWEVRTNMLMGTLREIRRLLPFKEIPRK
jgi:hypothetical protein